jgi:5-methylcytosine-specific restriction endonuclease McrA
MLGLLDEGHFVATYKFAVLLALIELCEEKVASSGAAPEMVTTRELAGKAIEIYWPQTSVFDVKKSTEILRQNTGRQAAIVQLIARFRAMTVGDASVPLSEARHQHGVPWERLVADVEWKLVEMPLPRLQFIGDQYDPFLYHINWGTGITRSESRSPEFDNRILFVGRAGDHLLRLAGLLRPLIQRHWSAMVARINRQLSEEARLDEFLFGATRIPLGSVRQPLREFQDNRCSYCDGQIRGVADIDHFIPWARHPDNGIENLVAAHGRCNSAKSSSLAALDHVKHWTDRFLQESPRSQLREIAADANWDRHPARTFSVARSIYLQLTSATKLWVERRHFVPAEPRALRALLRHNPPADPSAAALTPL